MPSEVNRLTPDQMNRVVNHTSLRNPLEKGVIVDLPRLAGTNRRAHALRRKGVRDPRWCPSGPWTLKMAEVAAIISRHAEDEIRGVPFHAIGSNAANGFGKRDGAIKGPGSALVEECGCHKNSKFGVWRSEFGVRSSEPWPCACRRGSELLADRAGYGMHLAENASFPRARQGLSKRGLNVAGQGVPHRIPSSPFTPPRCARRSHSERAVSESCAGIALAPRRVGWRKTTLHCDRPLPPAWAPDCGRSS